MIELRKFHPNRVGIPYAAIPPNHILQYRQTYAPIGPVIRVDGADPVFWTEWKDVPDVFEEDL